MTEKNKLSKAQQPTAVQTDGQPAVGEQIKTDPIRVEGLKELREVSQQLKSQGYIPLPGYLGGGDGIRPSYEGFISSRLSCADGKPGNNDLPLIHVSSGYAQPVKAAGGHEGAYITWGAGNRLPNVVSLLCSLSPYTAAALKFNIDLATGMGPKPMYSYTQYVGGNITHKTISYDSAGTLLKGWKIDLLRQIHDLERERQQQDGASQASSSDGTITTNDRLLGGQSQEPVDEYEQSLRDRLAEIEEDLAVWEQTMEGLREFMEHNNLLQTFQQLNADMLLYNICFPELELQQNYTDPDTGHNVKSFKWDPLVTGLRWRNAKTARLEQMDNQNRINYVYLSNQWLSSPEQTVITKDSDFKIDAIPAISSQSPAADLERIVREARQANVARRARPTHVACPVRYNEYGHPYYPIPAWYSVFSGDVYLYASTLISDRKKRRDNANVLGYVIYLSDEYMQRMYMQRGLTEPEQKKKLFDEVVGDINAFLKDRNNTGKPLLAYTFTGQDGKPYKSWEIVEIEESSKSTAEANQKELAEVSSIILFAWGADSRLIGNTPGDVSSSGGTDLRERYLLKQVQMASLQRLVLSVMDVIRTRNRWDTHLTWEIQREVLTTLDNSKTGITTAEDTSR